MTELLIVMYHYVRDPERTQFPNIKARTVAQFQKQLEYVATNYSVVKVQDIVSALQGGANLPANAAWLTFDDGYIDHFQTVYPLLRDRGWQGAFFPPVYAVRDARLLDVNAIQFVLAAQSNTSAIIGVIQEALHGEKGLRTFDAYWNDLAMPSRFDSADVIFIKRMLQVALPIDMRRKIIADLFERFVSSDASAFAADLYMTPNQLQEMIDGGMYVGSHGAGHCWLDDLDRARQADDIDESLAFLRDLGAPTKNWIMCYPWGRYNDDSISILKERACAVALTTRVAKAKIGVDERLALPRLDTNDLPFT